MKKINRLKANTEFAFTIKNGRAFKTPSFIVFAINNEMEFSRVGISVPTKLGNAVMRSTTRRQIRAMCDSLIDYASHTFDIVIIVREGYLKNNFNENKEMLNKSLSNQIGTK